MGRRGTRRKKVDVTTRSAVSVVLAARDEARRIGPAVSALVASLETVHRPWEVVFADAASRDGTAAVVERMGRSDIRVLHTNRRTTGAAARDGVLAATSPIVVVIDRELTRPFCEIESLVDAIEPGGFDLAVAVVTGSVGRPSPQFLHLFHHDGHPAQAGMVALRRATATRLVTREDGSAHAVELVQRAERLGLRVANVPVHDTAVARSA